MVCPAWPCAVGRRPGSRLLAHDAPGAEVMLRPGRLTHAKLSFGPAGVGLGRRLADQRRDRVAGGEEPAVDGQDAAAGDESRRPPRRPPPTQGHRRRRRSARRRGTGPGLAWPAVRRSPCRRAADAELGEVRGRCRPGRRWGRPPPCRGHRPRGRERPRRSATGRVGAGPSASSCRRWPDGTHRAFGRVGGGRPDQDVIQRAQGPCSGSSVPTRAISVATVVSPMKAASPVTPL